VTEQRDRASAVLAELRRRGWTLAVAESCTGGLLGAALTEVPGASDVFLGGVIAYSNLEKTRALGVDPALLASHGAVSGEVALAMAAGVRARTGADVSVAVTGIAGPGGAVPGKPVGTVWIAAIGPGGLDVGRHDFGSRSRDEVRRGSVLAALAAVQVIVSKASP
jgi:nicotinamide-nucleotide amidase